MPGLPKTPSVEQFATAWTQHFAAAIRAAAGKDGRLSRNEAKKIAGRDDALRLWGDNAINYLEAKNQKTVGVEKLIRSGYRYAYANAAKQAGSNRKVSFVEARRMAVDLRHDFLWLRAKGVEAAAADVQVTGETLAALLDEMADGLLYMSEADYPYDAFSLPMAADEPLTVVSAAKNFINEQEKRVGVLLLQRL